MEQIVTERLHPSRERLGSLLWRRWRGDVFAPGACHEDGFFFRFDGTRMIAARFWGPDAGAWLLDASGPLRWEATLPWLDIAGPNLSFPSRARGAPWLPPRHVQAPWSQLLLAFPEDEKARAWNERAHALPAALADVPGWAARRLRRADPTFQWQLLRWLDATGVAGAELFDGNPALAALLAARGEDRGLDAREAVTWRRKRLAEALGLPGRRSTVVLLGKLRVPALRPDLVLRVGSWLHEPRRAARVAHAQRIGLAGLVFGRPEELDWIDDALLLRLLETDEPGTLQVLHDFVLWSRRLRELGAQVPTPIRTLTQLTREAAALRTRGEMLHALSPWRALAPPPVAPVPGFVEALRTVGELDAEAETMRHCVRDYAHRALEGRVALYRVLRPERATLCLEPSRRRGWRVAELRLARNGRPSAETVGRVDAWLAQQGRSATRPDRRLGA